MNIKSKLRRGFDQAAPDVWGRIQEKLPQQKKTADRGITMSMEKRSAFREFVSTAAAFVVMVTLVGGGLWMYLTYGPLRPSNPDPKPPVDPDPEPSTEPATQATESKPIAPVSSATPTLSSGSGCAGDTATAE